MPGPYFFAWCDEATPWSEALQREDEAIFGLAVGEDEGDFAVLNMDVVNPRVGLLAAGRNLWGWLAWDSGAGVVPLFHGRLVGVPEDLHDEKVRLMFIARASDYPEQKAALAAALRQLPFHDPLWFDQETVDDDAVLETRTLSWQSDRRTLAASAADILTGDDGVIEIGADAHFRQAMRVSFNAAPRRRAKVTATVSWVQRATGEVDLTDRLVAEFRAAGSFFPWPMVGSYTADGLLSGWPQPGAGLGGGWSMAAGSGAAAAEFVAPAQYAVRYTDKSDSTSIIGFEKRDSFGNPLPGERAREFFAGWRNYDVVFGLAPIVTKFTVRYEASRRRSEVLTFTMAADVQSITTDAGASEEVSIDLTSALVDQPIDADGALPIGDPRRNLYFPTDRGQLSVQFLMLLAAARLLASSRAVVIKFETKWTVALADGLSCRKSVRLMDPRLPAGEATGKIVHYRLLASGSGDSRIEVTIACAVGYGVALGAADPGEDDYAEDYADDWTESTGRQTEILPGQLLYQSLDGTIVIDDDGVDLFNMTPGRVITTLAVTGGPAAQQAAIAASLALRPDDTRVETQGDVDGVAVSNLTVTAGLVVGTTYNVIGFNIPGLNAVGGVPTTFAFDGAAGGTLSRAALGLPLKGVGLTLYRPSGATVTPDPIGALRATPTAVQLVLVPVDGGDFMTPFAIDVAPLVVPKMIDLEAA